MYSQQDEEAFILNFFEKHPPRHMTFCDIGAFDGIGGSNTRALAERGWKGIMLEPHPVLFKDLEKNVRFEGVQLVNAAVGDVSTRGREISLSFPISKYGMLQVSTCLPLEKLRWTDEKWEITSWDTVQVPLISLKEVMEVMERISMPVEFLSIDAEGMDFEVLKSGEPFNYFPSLIMLEHNENRNKVLDLCNDYLRPLSCYQIYNNSINAAWSMFKP